MINNQTVILVNLHLWNFHNGHYLEIGIKFLDFWVKVALLKSIKSMIVKSSVMLFVSLSFWIEIWIEKLRKVSLNMHEEKIQSFRH